jgi:hypothetical protein
MARPVVHKQRFGVREVRQTEGFKSGIHAVLVFIASATMGLNIHVLSFS